MTRFLSGAFLLLAPLVAWLAGSWTGEDYVRSRFIKAE
jgi:hypothetical protein